MRHLVPTRKAAVTRALPGLPVRWHNGAEQADLHAFAWFSHKVTARVLGDERMQIGGLFKAGLAVG